jgi:hypothetical protein
MVFYGKQQHYDTNHHLTTTQRLFICFERNHPDFVNYDEQLRPGAHFQREAAPQYTALDQ